MAREEGRRPLNSVKRDVHRVVHIFVEVSHELTNHRVVPSLLRVGCTDRDRAAQDRISPRKGEVLEGEVTHTQTNFEELPRRWDGGVKLDVEPLARRLHGNLAGRRHERGGGRRTGSRMSHTLVGVCGKPMTKMVEWDSQRNTENQVAP